MNLLQNTISQNLTTTKLAGPGQLSQPGAAVAGEQLYHAHRGPGQTHQAEAPQPRPQLHLQPGRLRSGEAVTAAVLLCRQQPHCQLARAPGRCEMR